MDTNKRLWNYIVIYTQNFSGDIETKYDFFETEKELLDFLNKEMIGGEKDNTIDFIGKIYEEIEVKKINIEKISIIQEYAIKQKK